jgi:hypothetical protein
MIYHTTHKRAMDSHWHEAKQKLIQAVNFAMSQVFREAINIYHGRLEHLPNYLDIYTTSLDLFFLNSCEHA